jgi:diacylglycerol kinase (ATP)
MADVAVVAHAGKSFGGGLPELREILAREGVTDPLWYEVKKSRRAPKYARRAAAKGADVLFVWGGDGSVQRCIDAVAGTDTAVAILPAGTANLLAANLEVPHDLAEAVQVGLHGDRRRLDTGSVNGERFMVMAGSGFDARMISEADRGAKDKLGRAAYVVTGIRNLAARRARATVEVDGKPFFAGKVSCVLAANVGKILGGVVAFPQAQPDDGRLELGVVTARNPVQWARTFGRLAVGHPDQSPFVTVTQGKKFRIRFDRKVRYELDGGARPATRKLRIKVRPASVTICVPPARQSTQNLGARGDGRIGDQPPDRLRGLDGEPDRQQILAAVELPQRLRPVALGEVRSYQGGVRGFPKRLDGDRGERRLNRRHVVTAQAELLSHAFKRMQAQLPYSLAVIQQPVVVPVGQQVERKLRPRDPCQFCDRERGMTVTCGPAERHQRTDVDADLRVQAQPQSADRDEWGGGLVDPPQRRAQIGQRSLGRAVRPEHPGQVGAAERAISQRQQSDEALRARREDDLLVSPLQGEAAKQFQPNRFGGNGDVGHSEPPPVRGATPLTHSVREAP